MKSMAFIFSNAPYGDYLGREGLDFIISCSLTCNKIALFFIDDGIFQLKLCQKPELVKLHNYSLSFKVLLLYGIKKFFFCKRSAYQRGFKKNNDFLLPVEFLNKSCIKNKIDQFDFVLKW
ncbi:Protein TusC [Buchnera aphidicola (Cinara pseudotaxifoliae)]|uniref:Protein TusC n=1 Tax=Buchnera aphidicola (Cinara pseudotaxifoliae) TaxID=655384 RepID=A0A451DHT2_9GAMM|nr:sulfurtransferase complex subunit TusC [Buchnera aphidicola]VFP86209.1 Protein TusC [Buchnera aphidicola (Cinara pseudotaxifoliae)]